MCFGNDEVSKKTNNKKLEELMELVNKDVELLIINMRLECIIIEDNNNISEELKDEIRVLSKDKEDKWEVSGINKKVRDGEARLTLV